jgi:hypothetical protein
MAVNVWFAAVMIPFGQSRGGSGTLALMERQIEGRTCPGEVFDDIKSALVRNLPASGEFVSTH